MTSSFLNATEPVVGIVVIGRNEELRLAACLESALASGVPLLYVDSGSRDRSVEIARHHRVPVHPLDAARPFSAARARNEGLEKICASHPSLRFVQFVDGDCCLMPEWISDAVPALDAYPDRAVVVGSLIEQHPEASIYNRLCAMEWSSAAGEITDFGALGGIMLVRVDTFRRLGGFKPEVIAGEDSEFGVRVALAGHQVFKLTTPMATHDADIHRFGQWWTRTVRSGHAYAQRFHLNGRSVLRDCARERRSIFIWGALLPGVALLGTVPTGGFSLALLLLYGLLLWRIVRYRHAQRDSVRDALLYGSFTVLGKFAQVWGIAKFQLNLARRRFTIIEYK